MLSVDAFSEPKCVWRPGSTRTRWGSLSATPDPLSRNQGGVLLTKGKGVEWRGGRWKEVKVRGEIA